MLGDWCKVLYVRFPEAKKELTIYKVMQNVPSLKPNNAGVQEVRGKKISGDLASCVQDNSRDLLKEHKWAQRSVYWFQIGYHYQ